MAAEADDREVGEQSDDGHISREQLEQEIEVLKRKLEAADRTHAQAQKQMDIQKMRTKQLIAAWKLRLEEGEQKLMKQARKMDNDMKEIVSNLMFLEGELRKEQRTIVKKLTEKDKVIAQQEKKINSLNAANLKLVEALNKLRLNPTASMGECCANGFNGSDVSRENSDVEGEPTAHVAEARQTPSPSPPPPPPSSTNRVRFKDDMVDVYEDNARNVVVKRTRITPAAFKHMRANTISYF